MYRDVWRQLLQASHKNNTIYLVRFVLRQLKLTFFGTHTSVGTVTVLFIFGGKKMKKIISFLLIICTLALCFTSCASLKSYEKNLGKGYKTSELDEDEIEDLADTFDIDMDDYGVKAVIEAKDKKDGYSAYIIQCKSSKAAKELVDDLDDTLELMESLSIEVDAVADGKYVIVGYEDVVDDALGK